MNDLIIRAKIIKDGANANGLKLTGDYFIGLRFTPRSDMARAADSLLEDALDCNDADIIKWLHDNSDGPYDRAVWSDETKTATP